METKEKKKSGINARSTNSFDFSKSEATFQNITIPNSEFTAKWIKDQGYSIGIENIKISKNYKTLESALNIIGYGVDKDEDGDDILVKAGEIDFEVIVRIVRALIITTKENEENN